MGLVEWKRRRAGQRRACLGRQLQTDRKQRTSSQSSAAQAVGPTVPATRVNTFLLPTLHINDGCVRGSGAAQLLQRHGAVITAAVALNNLRKHSTLSHTP